MSDLIDSRMGMLQTISHITRDQYDRARAWVRSMTDDPAVISEIMAMLGEEQ